MSKVIYTHFGVLSSVTKTNKGLVITNSTGSSRAMRGAYNFMMRDVQDRALSLIGQRVTITTSITTSAWSSNQYFCNIEASS